MYLIPKEFFITSGKALSEVSDLNAFDLALMLTTEAVRTLLAAASETLRAGLPPLPWG